MNDLDFLREASDVSAGAVRELRQRVLDAVTRRKRRRWLWVACAATAVVLLLVIGTVAPRREVETMALRPALPPPPPAIAPRPPVRSPAPIRKQAPPQAVIHLETSDPGVVIYLVSSNGGEE